MFQQYRMLIWKNIHQRASWVWKKGSRSICQGQIWFFCSSEEPFCVRFWSSCWASCNPFSKLTQAIWPWEVSNKIVVCLQLTTSSKQHIILSVHFANRRYQSILKTALSYLKIFRTVSLRTHIILCIQTTVALNLYAYKSLYTCERREFNTVKWRYNSINQTTWKQEW